MSSELSVELDQVSLTLEGPGGKINILNDASLKMRQGDALAIVGPSGSGKTTMLMIIAGLEKIDSGRIIVAGQDYSTLNEDDLAIFRRDNIGIVFQSFHLIPTMSAIENVAIPLEFAGYKNAFDVALSNLKSVGLEGRKDHYPGQLSGGEQQRVALARSFAARPKILLADEPTGNLDRNTGSQIIDLLFSLHEENNSSLILITHDPVLASRCSNVLSISDGKISMERV